MDVKRVVARVAAACMVAGAGLVSAQTYTEGFDNVAALPAAGWLQVNNGAPPTNPWFQGNSGIFPSFAGAPDSYVAANFLSAASGPLDNWLISPVISITAASQLSFAARVADAGFTDIVEILFSPGGGSALGGFTALLVLGPPTAWTVFTLDLPDVAAGRFAFRQRSTAEAADYLGIDSVVVTAIAVPIPEPETWALMGAGLAALSFTARRRRTTVQRSRS